MIKNFLVFLLFNLVYANDLLIPKGTILDFTKGAESNVLVRDASTGKLKRCNVKLDDSDLNASKRGNRLIFESCVNAAESQKSV